MRDDVKADSLTRPFRFEELLPVLEWMQYPIKTERLERGCRSDIARERILVYSAESESCWGFAVSWA